MNATGGKDILVVASKVKGWRWDGKGRTMLAGMLSGKNPDIVIISPVSSGELPMRKGNVRIPGQEDFGKAGPIDSIMQFF
jgi:hypothetical protein